MANSQWPTLAGRLSQPLTSELQALEQFERCHLEAGGPELSPYAKGRLEKLRKKEQKKKKSS
jgi:hypothetical protein